MWRLGWGLRVRGGGGGMLYSYEEKQVVECYSLLEIFLFQNNMTHKWI
jgi:hypothetical protein